LRLPLSGDHLRKGTIGVITIVLLVVTLVSMLALLSLGPLISSQAQRIAPNLKGFGSPPNSSMLTTTTTTSTANYGENPNFWYVGASSTAPSAESNEGLRSNIQVRNQTISDGVLSFWASEAFSDNLWAQVGYYIQNDSRPIAFYQIWNLTNSEEIVTGTEPVTSGLHLFSFELVPGTNTWNFSLDGASFGIYNMHTSLSSSSYPIYAMSEEGYAQSSFSFNPVLFQNAIQVYKAGSWYNVSYASSFGSNWGIQGHEQNALLGYDQISVGQGNLILNANSVLWSQ
jgi:hypothetical protein